MDMDMVRAIAYVLSVMLARLKQGERLIAEREFGVHASKFLTALDQGGEKDFNGSSNGLEGVLTGLANVTAMALGSFKQGDERHSAALGFSSQVNAYLNAKGPGQNGAQDCCIPANKGKVKEAQRPDRQDLAFATSTLLAVRGNLLDPQARGTIDSKVALLRKADKCLERNDPREAGLWLERLSPVRDPDAGPENWRG